jgi:Ca2+-binding RTX toxin-like protein
VARLVLALGKDGKAYLLNRDNLGGIGGALAVKQVARGPIITAPAVYPAGDGAMVAFAGYGSDCPNGTSNSRLIVLKIQAHPSPAISTAWCGAVEGRGSPIVTTSGGGANAIVWMAGAEGDNRLHGFRGDTGEPVFVGSDAMAGLRHFATILAADGRLFIAGDDRIYAFTP